MLTRLFVITLALVVLSGASIADWYDASGRGLIPFWMHAGGFYTLLVFINEHDDTTDVIHIRFCDDNGNYCSDPTGDMWAVRHGEMRTFSTTPMVPEWIPTTASYGYVEFRTVVGGHIHAWALIMNEVSGAAMVVPAYNQDWGF